MKLTALLSLTGVLAALFGLGFLLAPVQVLAIYGVRLEPNGAWLARYLGASLLSFGLLAWLARQAPKGPALRAVILGCFTLSAISLVLAVLHALSGLTNPLAWSSALIYLLLTLGFGYFQFIRRDEP
jgi:hypothetical protein